MADGTPLPAGVELEDRPCPIGCPPRDRPVVQGRDRFCGAPGMFTIVRCEHCGLMRTNPRPTPATMGAFYPDDYAPYVANAAPPAPPSRLACWLGLDTRRIPGKAPGRLLEIGCSSGDFLMLARSRGWSVSGIEFSPSAAETARARGLSVQTGTISSAEAPSVPYDVIVGWMVAEHLHDPIGELARLRSWIASDGSLALSVPDAGAFERRVFGDAWYGLQLPMHLYHYSPHTLRRVLEAAGWRVTRVRRQASCVNLLMSLAYRFDDWNLRKLEAWAVAAARSPRLAMMRACLGWLLAALHQSGRIEVWARPA